MKEPEQAMNDYFSDTTSPDWLAVPSDLAPDINEVF